MGYQEKYLKYKKKYIELKSTHNMKGGVDPDSFIGKNNPQQQPILLNFKELENKDYFKSKDYCRSLIMQDSGKFEELEIKDYLKLLEEAQKRDHRKIGKEMNYFLSNSRN